MNKLDDIYNMEKETVEQEPVSEGTNIIVVDTHNSIAQVEDVDQKIVELSDVEVHGQEMNQVAKVAMEGYEEAMELARNVDEKNAANLMAVAAQMQKTALNALTNKQKARAQAAELLMRKIELDAAKELEDANVIDNDAGTVTGDRNEILKMIKDEGQR